MRTGISPPGPGILRLSIFATAAGGPPNAAMPSKLARVSATETVPSAVFWFATTCTPRTVFVFVPSALVIFTS